MAKILSQHTVLSVRKLSNPMSRGGIGSIANPSKGAIKVPKIGKINVKVIAKVPKPSLGGNAKVQSGKM